MSLEILDDDGEEEWQEGLPWYNELRYEKGDEEEEDEVEPSVTEAVLNAAAERENLRQPKRNNVRRPPPDAALARRIAVARKEHAKLACAACKRVGVLLCDDERGQYVCTACGAVPMGDRPLAVGRDDTVRHRAVVNARRNYWKERVSQWARNEPRIPSKGIRRLRDAYQQLVESANAGRTVPLSPRLTKPSVRRIVIKARLSCKKYVEKWLSIRALFIPDDCPKPSAELIALVNEHFDRFLAAWEEFPLLRRGRTSMPHINFLFVNFFLLIGLDVYELYSPWFPQVTPAKLDRLQRIWRGFCRVLKWPIYTVERDAEGKLHRTELRVLYDAPPVKATVRGAEQKTFTETKLEQFFTVTKKRKRDEQ